MYMYSGVIAIGFISLIIIIGITIDYLNRKKKLA